MRPVVRLICSGSESVYVDLSLATPRYSNINLGRGYVAASSSSTSSRRRRLACGGLANHRNSELAEQDFLQLLRRVQIERTTGFGVSLRLQLQHSRRELRALDPEQITIHGHALAFHAVQHGHERLLDGFVDCLQCRQRFDLRPRARCSRSVTSASSAEYSAARSTST